MAAQRERISPVARRGALRCLAGIGCGRLAPAIKGGTMAQSDDLSKAIAQAKNDVTARRAATESVRQDAALRGLRKTLKRLQRRRRAVTAHDARRNAKAGKATGGEAAKAE